MKKILLILGVLVVGAVPANAEILKVQALSEFNTENPPSSIEVKAVSDMDLNEELLIMDGYILKGNLVDVVSPKRLKRDATFSFVLTEYTDNNGTKHIVNPQEHLYKGKFTTQFNYKHVAKTAALSVGNFFLQGLSIGYAAVEGAVKNEEGNRVKSSAISVYESTPISYVEKGEDIVILKDQIFCLKFKLKDDKKEINHEVPVTTVPEKLPDKAEVQLHRENTVFQDKNNEKVDSEPISEEEKDRRMNLKAPLPDEEYGVTIEDLQAEVLNKPSKDDNVAFRFGRSDSKSEEQTNTQEAKSSEDLKKLSQPASATTLTEHEEQIEGKDKQIFHSKEEQVSEKSFFSGTDDTGQEASVAEDANTEESSSVQSDEGLSNVREFKPQSKILKVRKNSKTDRLQSVDETDPAKSENTEEIQNTDAANQATENSSDVQTNLINSKEQPEVYVNDESTAVQEQQSVSSEGQAAQNSVGASEDKILEVQQKTTSEEFEKPAEGIYTVTNSETNQQSNTVGTTKPLKRRDSDSFENLVPELPAPLETPLAPLDLPDTY